MRRSFLIKPLLNEPYKRAVKGEGAYLFDEDGKRYLDGCSGAASANLGHGQKKIAETAGSQAERLAFTYRSQFSNEPAEKLAEQLFKLTGKKYESTFLVNSGSEAAETGAKMAIQHWQEKGKPEKRLILSRWMSYHGITMGALSLSGHPARREIFAHELSGTPLIEPPYCYRCPFGKEYPECGLFCASQLETTIARIGAEKIAAFIAEPIIGAAGGAITPPAGYYEKIEEICRRHDVLFIADEVMTGCGRTGPMLAMSHWDASPDIVLLGKGLGAGYTPIAAVLAKRDVIEPIATGSGAIMSGHTFSANPLSASVALAVLDVLEQDSLFVAAEENGNRLMQELENIKKRSPLIGDIRGKGLLIGVELVADKKTKRPFPTARQATETLVSLAKHEGLLLYPAAAGPDGRSGAAVLIAPPLNCKEEDLKQLVLLFERSIRAFEQKMKEKEGGGNEQRREQANGD